MTHSFDFVAFVLQFFILILELLPLLFDLIAQPLHHLEVGCVHQIGGSIVGTRIHAVAARMRRTLLQLLNAAIFLLQTADQCD